MDGDDADDSSDDEFSAARAKKDDEEFEVMKLEFILLFRRGKSCLRIKTCDRSLSLSLSLSRYSHARYSSAAFMLYN